MTTPTRREFLAATAAATVLPSLAVARTQRPLGTAKSCIFINMIGGPPHLDTFDPKPSAPAEYRGPFAAIQTKTPGVHLSELFPKLATLTDKFAMVRSMHHTAPPVHEAGLQLLNTGRLFRDGPEWPSVGAVVSYRNGFDLSEPWRVYPEARLDTGLSVSHGQGTGFLDAVQYGPSEGLADVDPNWNPGLAVWCQIATAHVREDARLGKPGFTTINQFSTVFDEPSWDCHADGGSLRTDLSDIRNTVAPSFDAAFAALLTDLDERGLLDTTLVVATGEFGRTPLLNANGGRDHWAGAWTALVAGGGVKGGRVIGRTDARGTEPTDRPVTPQELVASVFHTLGVPHDATIPGPDGKPVAVYPGTPVMELF
ncbi:DUF1501 domain-containing protein [Gemmata sp.]|uniref:DUF1501 domain-containing protein n=1 Tax=Gemmata sp. TaxID=1914242 RepID=UPI003F72231C